MPEPKKPRRRRRGFMEGPDRVHRLNSIYRIGLIGSDRGRALAASSHAALDSVASPEPGEDLDESELSENERRQAIARERMRREGRA